MRPASPRKPGRPAGVASEQTRARILAAARGCFVESGFAKASNRDIAVASGITSAALYHYFDSKAALYAAVQRDVIDRVLAVYHRSVEGQTRLVDQLGALLKAAKGLNREEPGLVAFAAFAALEIQRHSELQEVGIEGMDEIPRFFEVLLAAAVERGEIRDAQTAADLLNVILATLFGLTWLHGRVDADEHDRAMDAFEALVRGRVFERA